MVVIGLLLGVIGYKDALLVIVDTKRSVDAMQVYPGRKAWRLDLPASQVVSDEQRSPSHG
jgi:hypothetical protein